MNFKSLFIIVFCTLSFVCKESLLTKRQKQIDLKPRDKIISKELSLSDCDTLFTKIFKIENLKNTDLLQKKYKNDLSIFEYACLCGHTSIVKYGLQNDIHINIRLIDSQTPLILASNKNNTDLINYLIKNGADINAKDDKKETALFKIAKNPIGKVELVKLILQHGAEINLQNDFFNFPPIEEAILSGNFPVFNFLYEEHKKQEDEIIKDENLLLSAFASGKLKVAELLIPYHDLHGKKNDLGRKLLEYAIDYAVLFEVSKKYKYENVDGLPSDYHLELINLLLKSGVNINHKYQSNRNLLYNCRKYKNVVSFLIHNGIVFNHIDKKSFTVLQYLINDLIHPQTFNIAGIEVPIRDFDDFEGELAWIEELIAMGFTVNTKNRDPWNYILLEAIKNNRIKLTEALLKKNISLNGKNNQGLTALDIALSIDNKEIITLLNNYGGKKAKDL